MKLNLTLPGLSKIFGAPKPPPIPKPAPLPDPNDAAAKDAEKRAQQAALTRTGIAKSTKQTGALGDTSEPSLKRPTLLGQGTA